MSWLTRIKNYLTFVPPSEIEEGRRAYDLLQQVHLDNLNGFLYSGPTREAVAKFLKLPVYSWKEEEPQYKVVDCTRQKPHEGPCNGWLTPTCHCKDEDRSLRWPDNILS
jgi:hypothetical protein